MLEVGNYNFLFHGCYAVPIQCIYNIMNATEQRNIPAGNARRACIKMRLCGSLLRINCGDKYEWIVNSGLQDSKLTAALFFLVLKCFSPITLGVV